MNADPVIEITALNYRYSGTVALESVSLKIPARKLTGVIGPDGVGKSTLLSLISGVRAVRSGDLNVLGGSMTDPRHRNRILPGIAYMPQGLGKNLYPTLTVEENLRFFAGIFGYDAGEIRKRTERLTRYTGLFPFLQRAAGQLSGGMKQKLGLCCALIHDPELLILDEPTTGVDPLARRQFWELIAAIRSEQPELSVLTATSYMDEARHFDWLAAMDEGHILACGTPAELLERTACSDLDSAFIRLLPERKRAGHRHWQVPPPDPHSGKIVIKAENLTRKFGSFVAVDQVNFQIRQGEIFGFLGSNGCGKTTTMRMLTGLLRPTSGKVSIFGKPVGEKSEIRQELGYMTQQFSLYHELTVRQNLELYARLYGLPEEKVLPRTEIMLDRFDLTTIADELPGNLPPGMKQRLSLAAAVVHQPRILILDEPTSGVDPVARDIFWEQIVELSRRDRVTVFVTTHFMNEAERCDRVSLMHSGRVLLCGSPAELKARSGGESLEDVFIRALKQTDSGTGTVADSDIPRKPEISPERTSRFLDFRRFYSCVLKETLELKRDPFRIALALFGGMILMTVLGFGLNVDVEKVDFAVLDHDRSIQSNAFRENFAGSRYFRERKAIQSHADADARMKSGELAMTIEIPPGFGAELQKGKKTAVAFWIDGSETTRAETIRGYIESLHAQWIEKLNRADTGSFPQKEIAVQIRFLYNPEVRSLPAMVPSVMPVILLMIPAILSALSVVREKELGSIVNLCSTPLSRAEFLLGKQLPYVILACISSILLVLMAVFLFDVPVKGSLLLLTVSLLIYSLVSTGMGMLFSSVTRSQIAVIFLTLIGTVFPGVQLCGMITPVAEDGSFAAVIGHLYPVTYMLLIIRGVFNKGLSFAGLYDPLLILLAEALIIAAAGILLQKKQEG